MKKLVSLILAIGVAAPLFAAPNTPVTLAKKSKDLSEARSLIQQAINDPQYNQQAETYYVAGIIELDAYDKASATKMINPDDPSAAVDVMGEELYNAYNYFLKALPLDSLPNEKGQVKPKYSKDILNKIKGHQSDFFTIGADYYNNKEYYPQAYQGFLIYGDIPTKLITNDQSIVNQEQIATSYFNAGLAASQGGANQESAEAFKKARLAGYAQPEATIYEIACWQTIAQQDESRINEAQDHIMEAAQAGIDQFGLDQQIFINNLINSLVSENKTDEAIAKLNTLIDQNPDMPNLYGLRGYVYDRLENDDLSEADYRKAASLPTADFETLKNASNKLYRVGTAKLNALEGTVADASAREDIKNNYFLQAQKYAQQANEMQPGDSYIQNILDSIDYAVTTFFN
ncbi:MAG: hypothetical protein J1E16_03350 [Muribaculaceae bacterium]|nr:hypothetical protein [Muribaculaceae bacterium]